MNFRLSLYNKISKILFSGFVQSLLSFPIVAPQNSNVIAARYSNDLKSKRQKEEILLKIRLTIPFIFSNSFFFFFFFFQFKLDDRSLDHRDAAMISSNDTRLILASPLTFALPRFDQEKMSSFVVVTKVRDDR